MNRINKLFHRKHSKAAFSEDERQPAARPWRPIRAVWGLFVLGLIVIAVGLGIGLRHTHDGAGGNVALPYKNNTTPANVVRIASAVFLGNVSSTNTYDTRDGGWQGQVGQTFITTFADTVPCKSANLSDCAGLEASNSAGLATDTPLKYKDVRVTSGGNAMQFCPLIKGEDATTYAIWLSAVIETGTDQGIVFFNRIRRASDPTVLGAGVATVDMSSTGPVCNRSIDQWWDGNNEPFFGDHGAILGQDGYIYALGGAKRNGNNLFLARVPQASGANLTAYEYWHGGSFTSERLYSPSSEFVLTAGQGSMVYSPFYKKYLYFKPGCFGGACILVQAASAPQGPWSAESSVWGSGDSPDHYEMYAPSVQIKYSGPTSVVIMYTGHGEGFGNVLQAINIVSDVQEHIKSLL